MILSFPDPEPTVTFIFPEHYNFGRCPGNVSRETQLCLSAEGRCQPGMGGAGAPSWAMPSYVMQLKATHFACSVNTQMLPGLLVSPWPAGPSLVSAQEVVECGMRTFTQREYTCIFP